MARGYQANQDRINSINIFGKTISKRAGFRCEWCGSKNNPGVWDYRPDQEPEENSLALLCGRCRELSDGSPADLIELRAIRNALWSNVPAVAEGAAQVLSRCKEQWVREAIEESFIDEAVKCALLK